jgi:hypothetical protein
MNKNSLEDFFKESDIDISEFKKEPAVLSIQIIHLYHQIFFWYILNKHKKFTLFEKLLESKDIINSIKYLRDIPFELKAKYLSLIYPYASGKIVNDDINILCNKVKIIEDNDEECRAIYIKDSNKTPSYIIFKFYYHNIIILININTLEITQFDTIDECIKHVYIKCNKKIMYELTSIAYTPHYYRHK